MNSYKRTVASSVASPMISLEKLRVICNFILVHAYHELHNFKAFRVTCILCLGWGRRKKRWGEGVEIMINFEIFARRGGRFKIFSSLSSLPCYPSRALNCRTASDFILLIPLVYFQIMRKFLHFVFPSNFSLYLC